MGTSILTDRLEAHANPDHDYSPDPQSLFHPQGIYFNTSHANLGDYGSEVLPVMPSGTVWQAGSTVPVSWTIEANHGGGYQYRLAPRESITEETCQRCPWP